MNRGIPMANSKSNIYPIQLQGAELNLNKLDAEIKQYSGFNKNNSPFVGGCLSNVFTKEEQIENATDDNTIIDENGDIYTVNTEGLYKNGEKLVEYPEGTVFWDNKKINTDAARVFSEDIQVKKINDNYYLVANGLDPVLFAEPIEGVSEERLLFEFSCGVFYYQDGNLFFISASKASAKLIFNILKINNTDGVVTVERMQHEEFATSETVINENNDVLTAITLLYRGNPYGINPSEEILPLGHIQILVWARNLSITPGACCVFDYNVSDNELNLLASAADYLASRATPAPLMRFLHVSSHPYNVLSVKRYYSTNGNPSGGQTPSGGISMTLGFLLPYFDTVNNRLTWLSSTSGPVLDNLTDKINIYDMGQKWNLANGCLTNLFCCYDYQLNVTKDGNNKRSVLAHMTSRGVTRKGFSFSDYKTAGTTVKKGRYVLGDFMELGTKFHIAFNNNQMSGICGENVLLSDWNTLDPKKLAFCIYKDSDGTFREGLVYLSGSEWFVLTPGTPKIKKSLSQLVSNADVMNNSYDLERKIFLHFASAYNCFDYFGNYENADPYHGKRYDWIDFVTNTEVDNIYVAGAVNEHNQKDNSSIIINPISFYTQGLNSPSSSPFYFKDFNYAGACLFAYTKDVVNFYTDVGHPNEIKYLYSDKEGSVNAGSSLYADSTPFLNKDLIDLPFPIDTNGNVEYSPSLFSEIKSVYGNQALIKNGASFYPLVIGNNSLPIMSFFLASGADNFKEGFIIQGQFYGMIEDAIYNVTYSNGVISGINFIVDISNLQFVGNTPYEALFFSKTNRCLYSFTGANVLNQKQLVDKISEVRNYLYNSATQTVFLITDIGVLFYGLFGMFLLEYTNITNIFLLDNGIVMSDNNGNYRYIKYYLDEGDEGYTKENIRLETCFYGMNNEVVTINDCLYFRLFSEEHEEGDLKVSATTISLSGRKTEETTFKIKASDWDKITHTIYLRYQPKAQRGLGVSFSIDSPFKIASMSVGSQPDAVLVDKVSKGAITAPSVTTNNNEW